MLSAPVMERAEGTIMQDIHVVVQRTIKQSDIITVDTCAYRRLVLFQVQTLPPYVVEEEHASLEQKQIQDNVAVALDIPVISVKVV